MNLKMILTEIFEKAYLIDTYDYIENEILLKEV